MNSSKFAPVYSFQTNDLRARYMHAQLQNASIRHPTVPSDLDEGHYPGSSSTTRREAVSPSSLAKLEVTKPLIQDNVKVHKMDP